MFRPGASLYAMNRGKQQSSLVPRLMGSEHEQAIHAVARDLHEAVPHADLDRELFEIIAKSDRALWHDYFWDDVMAKSLLDDGSMLYWFADHQAEIATTECTLPSQLVRKSRALQDYLFSMLGNVLDVHPELRSLAMYERVVDARGNSWGEHDNFSLEEDQSKWGQAKHTTPGLIAAHLQTQGIVTGAGLVGGEDGDWAVAQKALFVDTMYGTRGWTEKIAMHGHEDRLEVRSHDKNVSEWAQWLRIGSCALVLAMARTEITPEKLGIYEDFADEDMGMFGDIEVTSDGIIKFKEGTRDALRIQHRLADEAVRFTQEHETDAEYAKIARAWQRFCQELTAAVENGNQFDLRPFLRADWAAKFWSVIERVRRDRREGKLREIGDAICIASDIRYGKRLHDAPIAGERRFVDVGIGYRLNDIDRTRRVATIREIEAATAEIPTERARMRVAAARDLARRGLQIVDFEWMKVEWLSAHGEARQQYLKW